MNNAKDSGNPERSVCGGKFREMLSCVEQIGTTACTNKINDFLACERSVFRTALAKQPPSTPQPDPVPQNEHTLNPNLKTQPKPNSAESDTMPSVGAMFSRVVDKQLNACTSMAETVRRPEFRVGLWSFSKRMVADVRVTCDAVGSKTRKVLNELKNWVSGNGD